jgi:hypothetical protein
VGVPAVVCEERSVIMHNFPSVLRDVEIRGGRPWNGGEEMWKVSGECRNPDNWPFRVGKVNSPTRSPGPVHPPFHWTLGPHFCYLPTPYPFFILSPRTSAAHILFPLIFFPGACITSTCGQIPFPVKHCRNSLGLGEGNTFVTNCHM